MEENITSSSGTPYPAGTQQVIFASTGNAAVTIGIVCPSGPSSLTLLAAGVAGMAARQARRKERIKFLNNNKLEA